MNNAEARARVAAQEKLRVLEAEVSQLASTHATPVLLAMHSARN